TPAGDLDGLRPAQTPQLFAGLSMGWESGSRAITLRMRHVGAQFEDDLNRQRLSAATTFDALVGWPLSQRLQLVARGENLLNETVITGIGGDGSIERATPRTLWLGLRLTEPGASAAGCSSDLP
ncbi:MAG: TonB-dependent receptor, partial [Sphingomonas sp.]|nr:TonB-dependent receptor [Sphingomonas sp.]